MRKVIFPLIKSMKRFFPYLAVLIPAVIPLRGVVSLPPLFGDHMVLQQRMTLPVWGTASPGEHVLVSCGERNAETLADESGHWRVTLRPLDGDGERLSLIVNGSNRIEIHDVVAGDVWLAAGEGEMALPLSGTSIGSRAGAIADSGTRFFLRDKAGKGRWVVVTPETAPSLPAGPFFFARDIRAVRKSPVGILDCAATTPAPIDSWISQSGLQGLALRARKPGLPGPSLIYSSMIKPLLPFAITGVIWSQGSSDASDPTALRHRIFLQRLIHDWRKVWGQGPFPFVVFSPPGTGGAELPVEPCRIANGMAHGTWPWIREGIMLSATTPGTGGAEGSDLGSADSDRPFDALVAGRRLALAARRVAYGEESDIEVSGPVYRSKAIEAGKIRILFDHAGGGLVVGTAPDDESGRFASVSPVLKGFAVRGKEGKWFAAEAHIDDESIVLSSNAVPHPVEARYGWTGHSSGNLYNRQGLPARPFRTDSDQPQ